MAEANARILGLGDAGRKLGAELAAQGVVGRAQLRRVADALPAEARVNVLYTICRRIPLALAQEICAELRSRARFEVGGRPVRRPVIAVGSVRRQRPHVKDLDLLVTLRAGESFEDVELAGSGRATLAACYARGPKKLSLVVGYRARGRTGEGRRPPEERAVTKSQRTTYYRCDFFATTAEEKAYAIYHHTGPVEYNIRVRAHAKKNGWRLNQYGLFDATSGRRVGHAKTERELAKLLGVSYAAPSARE